MNLLFVGSEVAPYAKTGGLADVMQALPAALSRMGHHVRVILPYYRCVKDFGARTESTGVTVDVPIRDRLVQGTYHRTTVPGSDVELILVEQDDYFDRIALYGEAGSDYYDNCERFVFFCRAAIEAIRLLDLKIDILHCNDWQTGLIPAYLKSEYAKAIGYRDIATVLTVHNLAFQGVFWHYDMPLTGLDWKYFSWDYLEFYGRISLLKAGLVFADQLTTVSPRYADEIQSPEFGCGMDSTLRYRSGRLHGIVNGIDVDVWNPANDPEIAANYDLSNWRQGKAACKAALQKEFDLYPVPDVPLVGQVGRLTEQKGWRLILPAMEALLEEGDIQFAILGTGERDIEAELHDLQNRYRGRVSFRREFSESLAHRIEAGVDLFMMPSIFEPCGLAQLQSLRYGTVPVVRRTGGLADTITDVAPDALAEGTANGYSFDGASVDSFVTAMQRALEAYRHRPDEWSRVVENGMRQDWTWEKSAARYEEVYREAICVHREWRQSNP